jgi:type II secretory pathway component PulK
MFLFLPAKKEKKKSKNCRGAILIVALWVLTILTVFAIALGYWASLEVKLVRYQRDKLKAGELAKAAIERAILEKQNDTVEEVDALSERWANNRSAFKDFVLGEGTFTVSYSLGDAVFYGIEDEESKINLNKIDELTLVNLLEDCEVEDAQRLAHSILVWCARINDPDEESEYEDLSYSCKKDELKSVAELLLVRGMTSETLYGEDKDGDGKISKDEKGIVQYLTVFGDGEVNINTASEKVLSAIFGNAYPELAEKVVIYRKGVDGKIGTNDDYWFASGIDTVDLGDGKTKDVKDLKNDYATFTEDPLFQFTEAEWTKMRNLESAGVLSVNSNTYTINSQAEVKKLKESIVATIKMNESPPKYLSWYRD